MFRQSFLVVCFSISIVVSLPFGKGVWHAVILKTTSCTTASPWNISLNFQTKRINEYSSTMMGSFIIGKEVPSLSKIDAYTYAEKGNGETVKKISITYKDICRLMNEENIFLDPFFEGSDLPRQCPLKPGEYRMRNVTYSLSGEYTGVVPVGVHRAELRGFCGASELFCLRLVVELATSGRRMRRQPPRTPANQL